MEIGIENQPFPEQRIFGFQRLLDLHHHIHQMPDIGGVVDQGSAGIHIFIVGKAGTEAGAFFDIHMMAGGDVCLYIIRREADTEFIVFDFFDATDFHEQSSFPFVVSLL